MWKGNNSQSECLAFSFLCIHTAANADTSVPPLQSLMSIVLLSQKGPLFTDPLQLFLLLQPSSFIWGRHGRWKMLFFKLRRCYIVTIVRSHNRWHKSQTSSQSVDKDEWLIPQSPWQNTLICLEGLQSMFDDITDPFSTAYGNLPERWLIKHLHPKHTGTSLLLQRRE